MVFVLRQGSSRNDRSTKKELKTVMGTYQRINIIVYSINSIYIRTSGCLYGLFLLLGFFSSFLLLVILAGGSMKWSSIPTDKIKCHLLNPVQSISQVLSMTKSTSLTLAHSKQITSNKGSRGSFLSCAWPRGLWCQMIRSGLKR